MKKDIVYASDAGKAAYCPHSLSLSKKKFKSHAAAVELQKQGTKEHDNLTDAVILENGGQDGASKSETQDSRCYVASYAFGVEHPVTLDLRNWRDNVLLNRFGGRTLVKAYYLVSPQWVRICRQLPVLGRLSKAAVTRIHSVATRGR